MLVHLDTDFLVYAVTSSGVEHRRLRVLSGTETPIQMSAVAWYEFCRGPRTPGQKAAARSFLGEDGIVPFSEDLATLAADIFRNFGSSRRRSADVAIGVTAAAMGALLLSRNVEDFAGIPHLEIEATD
jgi:predicted nucleic acid-binding protein